MTELERVAEQYANENSLVDEVPIPQVYEDAFKAGANWQYEQFEKERLKHCDELTAEQAQIESDFVTEHLRKNNRTPTFIDAIEYGKRLMIDKACEWLSDNCDAYKSVGYEDGHHVLQRVNNNVIDDFKKAMED